MASDLGTAGTGIGLALGGPVGWGIAAVGLITSIFGGISEAEAQADARREQAHLTDLRANEVLDRNDINTEILRIDADRHQGLQSVQIAASGRTVDASTAGAIEGTYRLMEQQIERNTRATNWEVDMLRREADSLRRGATAIQEAGTIKAIGQGISSAANIYDKMPGQTGASIKSGINSFGQGVGSVGRSVVGGVTRGLSSAVSNINDAMVDVENYYFDVGDGYLPSPLTR